MAHIPETTEPEERRVLNLKALALLVGGGILVSIGIGRIHATQVERTSEYLKSTAEAALEEGEHRRSFDLYEQYMTLNPNDDEVDETISELLEKHGNSAKALQRAFRINERLLLADKDRDDIRLRQISIADRLGRYSDAAVHLKIMREKRSDLSRVWHFSGIVARDTGNFQDAITYFGNATALEDPPAESFQYLAELKTSENEDAESAFELLNKLVDRDDSAKARRIRADWLMKQNRHEEAIPDLWIALQEDSTDVRTNAMLLKSIRVARASDPKFGAELENRKLVDHLNAVLLQDPDQPRLRLYLSSALWATRQRDAAIANLRYGISRDPRQFEMYEVLVDYLVSSRRYTEAQETFDEIPERVIDRGRREFMRGRLLMAQKQWLEAIEAFNVAIGFAHDDANISSRARICLALCRRESGDNAAALEAYTALIQANPDFEGGRIGIASAYLQAEQIPMAIAEYKQLLHVDGVPPFLANLMIKYNLTLPKQQRDWDQVADILRDENPVISDPVQRGLLQADLQFAEGFPAQAMDHLDRLARRIPDRPEIERARQRLSNVHGDKLMSRVQDVLREDPRNIEGHISILRLQMARNDVAGMDNWLNRLQSGASFPKLSKFERLRLLAESATIVADAELVTRGQSTQLQVLQDYASKAWRELSASGREYLRRYVRFVGVHQSAQNAITVTEWVKANSDVPMQAACWVECLKAGVAEPAVQSRVTSEIVALIRRNPADMSLRLTYAESRILLQQYENAEQLLLQIAEHDPQNAAAFGRLAWLEILVNNDVENGIAYSARASELYSGDISIRSIRALAFTESGQPDTALKMLTSIPERDRTVASRVFEARALTLVGRKNAARDLVLELSQAKTVAQLDPAEIRLLTKLQNELNVESRHAAGI